MIPLGTGALKWAVGIFGAIGLYLKGKKKGIKKGVNRLAKEAAKRKDGKALQNMLDDR